jgi:hypothetical protein
LLRCPLAWGRVENAKAGKVTAISIASSATMSLIKELISSWLLKLP